MSKTLVEGEVETRPREVLAGNKFAADGLSLSIEEQAIFQKLITTKEPANVIIPDSIDGAELWKYLNVTMKAVTRAQQALTRLKPFLGRILLLIKERPHLYQNHGYSNFSDFMSTGVPALFGISRPEAYNCVKVADALDFLAPEKMEKLGFAKLNVLASAIRHDTSPDMTVEMREEKRQMWVKAAEGSTVLQLKERMANDLLIEDGTLDKVTIQITATELVRKDWEGLSQSPAAQAHCGTPDPGAIFGRLIEECRTEWIAQAFDENRINEYKHVSGEALPT